MHETEKGKRMEQILASGVTREELAEALFYAERSVESWREFAEANRSKVRDLEIDAVHTHFETMKLMAENERLRGMMPVLWEKAVNGERLNYTTRLIIRESIRELGIEVSA